MDWIASHGLFVLFIVATCAVIVFFGMVHLGSKRHRNRRGRRNKRSRASRRPGA